MNHNARNVEKIVQKGFCRIAADEKKVTSVIEQIIHNGSNKPDNVLHFRFFRSKQILAVAAAILLFLGFGYAFYLFISGYGSMPLVSGKTDSVKKTTVTILSGLSNENSTLEKSVITDSSIRTDSTSQLLLAVGSRTRAILFEKSYVEFPRVDSYYTVIALHSGIIVVDISPGGCDTISVVTPYGIFTQIGTRFSVSFDSLQGARLEVYHGKVRVRDSLKTDLCIAADQKWDSKQRKSVCSMDRSSIYIEKMQDIFSGNKIMEKLRWENSSPAAESIHIKSKHAVGSSTRNPESMDSVDYAIQRIKLSVDRKDYNAAGLFIAKLKRDAAIDTLHTFLKTAAKQKISSFGYPDAAKILELIISSEVFSIHQRENAWMQFYLLNKEQLKAAPDERLKMITQYQSSFPDGSMRDDMSAESIQLLVTMKRYETAISAIKKFLQLYPQNVHSEYFHYLHASILREHLKKRKDALEVYKQYTSIYSQGKYEEDALYWIVRLSELSGDTETFQFYRKIYLQRYPQGRWSEVIKKIKTAANRG